MSKNLTAAKRFIEAFMALVVGHRVPVRWGRSKVASMDKDRIVNLPAPTTGEADELALLTRLALHEAGHTEHTQPDFGLRLTPEEVQVWNALEDPRMERQLTRTYPGALVVLSRGLDRLLADIQAHIEKGANGLTLSPACMELFFRGMLAMTPHKPAVERVPAILQALAPHVTDAQRTAIDEALAKLPGFTSSLDCEEAAKVFVARLRDQEQELPPPQESDEPQDQPMEQADQGNREGQSNEADQAGDSGQGEGDATQDQRQDSHEDGQQASAPGNSGQQQDRAQDGDTQQPQQDGAGDDTDDTDGAPAGNAGDGEEPGGDQAGDAGDSEPDAQNHPSAGTTAAQDATSERSKPGSGSPAPASDNDPAASTDETGDAPEQPPCQDGASGANLPDAGQPGDLGQLLRQVLAERYGGGDQGESGEDESEEGGTAQAGTGTEPTVADLQRLEAVLQGADPGGDLSELVEASLAAVARATGDGGADTTSGGGAGLSLAGTKRTDGLAPERSRLEGVQGKLVTVLRRELQDKRRRPVKPAHAGSRVMANRFWRLSALGDTKVFAQRHKVNGIDAAATVLLDSSDSMAPIFDVAVDSTLAFSLALQRLGVRTKVVRFPGAETLCETLQEFGETPRGCKERCAHLVASGGTPIGAATAVQTQVLLQQRRLTNMLALITDGQPGDGDTYRAALHLADQQGVLVVGVGIGCDISHWVQNSVMVSDVTELPDALALLFRNNISEKLAA